MVNEIDIIPDLIAVHQKKFDKNEVFKKHRETIE
jgi:hypothetical protein